MQKTKKIPHELELGTVAENTAITITGKAFGGGIQLLFNIAVARFLGVEAFGLFMLTITIFSFAGVFSRLGLDSGAVRYVSQYKGINDMGRVKGTIIQSMKYSLIASIFLTVCMFLTAKPLATIFNKPELEKTLRLISFFLPFFSLFIIALSSTRGFQKIKYMVYGYNLFLPVSGLVLIILSSLLGFKLKGVITAYGISFVMTFLISMYFLKKVFPGILHTKAVPETKSLLKFSVPLLLISFSHFFIMWTDTVMIGYFRSSAEVGIYNAAAKIAVIVCTILASINPIFEPMLSDLFHRNERQKLEYLFKTLTKWSYIFSLPVFLIIIFLSKEIMSIYGQDFIIGWIPLVILSVAQLINASTGSVGWILIMSGKQNLVMYNSIFMFLLNIILNYFLIPVYGITGASLASGITIIVFNLTTLFQVYFILKIHPYNYKFLSPTLLCLAVFAVMVFIRYIVIPIKGLQNLYIYIPLFLTLYGWLIYRWGTDEEDKIVVDLFKNKMMKIIS